MILHRRDLFVCRAGRPDLAVGDLFADRLQRRGVDADVRADLADDRALRVVVVELLELVERLIEHVARVFPLHGVVGLFLLVADVEEEVFLEAAEVEDGDVHVVRGAVDGEVDVQHLLGRVDRRGERPLSGAGDDEDEGEEDEESGEEPFADGDLLKH